MSIITKAITAIGATILLASPASARTTVDSSTLNPAPPDFFNAVCTDDGQHITCTFHFADPDIVDEPTGILCGGTELLFSQSRSVEGNRLYDTDGDLVRRHFREYFSGTLTNPDTGRVAFWRQHDTVLHKLTVPGDLSSGTISFTGLWNRVWAPSGATILTDSGLLVQDAATGEMLEASAHHPLNDYFGQGDTNALAPLCNALG